MHIPTPETITAAWLTERLRAAGHAAAEVRGFTATRVGTGQIGKCIRFALDLAGGDATTPRSLVGKFPSDDPTSRPLDQSGRKRVPASDSYDSLGSSEDEGLAGAQSTTVEGLPVRRIAWFRYILCPLGR